MKNINQNKGFSLVELLTTIAILMVVSAILATSYMNLTKEAKKDKDIVKFESICSAFKSSLGEPEVMKEAATIGGGSDLKVVCHIGADGKIDFGNGQLIGVSTGKTMTLKESDLWLNAYQTVGLAYTTESKIFVNQDLIFTLTPKTSTTTAKCEYTVSKT